MGDSLPTVRVAAVQAAPVFLNREATLDKAVALIGEAAGRGARIIVFPEVFIAGYPYWNRLRNVFTTARFFTALLKHAVTVPGPETARLCEAARRAGAWVLVGINERAPETLGTLYNANLLLGPEGTLLLRHRKLMPTYAEKLTWGFGDGSSVRVLDTPVGRLGTLICGENANPLARYALIAQGEQIHLSNYPALPAGDQGGYDLGEDIRLRGAAHAFEGKVFNVVASAVIDDAVARGLEATPEERRLLAGPQMAFTGVFAPGGRLLAGPLAPGEEGIVYADCDLEAIIGPKLRHDIAGQYNRFDVFALHLDRTPRRPLVETGTAAPAAQPAGADAGQPPAEPGAEPGPQAAGDTPSPGPLKVTGD